LLFVAALIFLISDRWKLVKTITAFTVAHCVTLAGAALGYLSLPQRPVEATIALSITFVASDPTKMRERRLSVDYPWVIAFAFGLLHGFGFAGALKEMGLHRWMSLLLLSCSIWAWRPGELLFVTTILIGFRAASALFTIPIASGPLPDH
jgi:hypothetical protein